MYSRNPELCEDCKENEKWSFTGVEIFLKEIGIEHFLVTDGDYIKDKKNDLHFSMWNYCSCGNRITSLREINFQIDFFNILYEASRTGVEFLDRNSRPLFKFVGKCPLPGSYNAAVVRKLGAFDDGGYDGSCYYEMWSALLLNVNVRYKTAEELTEEERIRKLPPNPLDDFPPF
ncbi:MAG: hypothetical protein ACD_5C00183G0001 [uncultured bacterium]|nr:MAG: hypothetical protein ACD_5C00183G0001 [uncultured bacterium]KKQ59869.1 MAG: hypothetical protein US82_C0049G0006 [Parcubacteria group bacterium GW2011_GWC1_38_22]